jgi:hypothetical protein
MGSGKSRRVWLASSSPRRRQDRNVFLVTRSRSAISAAPTRCSGGTHRGTVPVVPQILVNMHLIECTIRAEARRHPLFELRPAPLDSPHKMGVGEQFEA